MILLYIKTVFEVWIMEFFRPTEL
ncbi:DNA polymerase V subunit UmuD, partial [Salmonella enterica subsp. enterica serovar Derby]